jgi:phospholipid/cholesterol/gamma-HCH transport system ATP-binding protein
VVPQIVPTPGLPERAGERRRKDRVMRILHTLPEPAQKSIVESLTPEDRERYGVGGAQRPATPLRPSPRPRPARTEEWQRSEGDLSEGTTVAELPRSNWRNTPPDESP